MEYLGVFHPSQQIEVEYYFFFNKCVTYVIFIFIFVTMQGYNKNGEVLFIKNFNIVLR